MSRMTRRTSYTAIAFAGFAAILLALPVKAQKSHPSQVSTFAFSPPEQVETAPIALIHDYERADITPNEEVAGVVIQNSDAVIWGDDFVVRADET